MYHYHAAAMLAPSPNASLKLICLDSKERVGYIWLMHGMIQLSLIQPDIRMVHSATLLQETYSFSIFP